MITRRSWRALVRVAALAMAVALCFGSVPMAYAASLSDAATYKTTTNPAERNDPNTKWRWGWGNSWFPDLSVSPPTPADGFLYEFRNVDPSAPTLIIPDWGSPMSAEPTSTVMNATFDVAGAATRYGWVPIPGAAQRGEGLYQCAVRFYDDFDIEEADETEIMFYGIDVTKPSPVTGLVAYSGAASSDTVYTEAAFRDLQWTPSAYDALSGVGGFNLMVGNTGPFFVHNAAPDPNYEPYASFVTTQSVNRPQTSNVSVEDLKCGVTNISIAVVDRATNVSEYRTVKAYVDTDTPTLKITKPAAGGKVGVKPTMSVVASDKAGISAVRYYVDDKLVYTSTKAPYSGYPDLSSFASGGHTLKVVAADMIGTASGPWTKAHTTTATVSFTLDKSAPSMSITSKGPNPFYPRKREGYKDNYIVKFNTNEAGTAYLDIYYGGKLYRSVKKSMVSGANSISWDGKSSSGALKATSYSVKLRLVDAAGNTRTSSSFGSTIRFYEVVRTSSGSARVIER